MARDPFFLDDDEEQADEALVSRGVVRVPPDDEPVGPFLAEEVGEPEAPATAARVTATPARDPRDPALQAWRAGRFEEAERLLTALAESAPGNDREPGAEANALFDLGRLYADQERYDLAAATHA